MSVTPSPKSKFDQLRDRVLKIHNMMYGSRSWKSQMSDRVGHTHEILRVLVQEHVITRPTIPVHFREDADDDADEEEEEDARVPSPLSPPPRMFVPLSSKMKDNHKMLCILKSIIIGESTSVITGGVDAMIHECDVIIAFLCSTPQPAARSTCVIV